MSYANGAFGGPARCYDHFAGFMRCMETASHPYFCVLEREDYFECLHMAKLRRRASVLSDAVDKQAADRAELKRRLQEVERMTSS